jgi:hypothetical protein
MERDPGVVGESDTVRILSASRFSLLVALAVRALLAKVAFYPLTPVDSCFLTINGVRLGMTGDEVIGARGLPIDQHPGEDGATDWVYGDLTVRLKSGSGDHLRVVYAGGTRLDAGTESLLAVGVSEAEVRRVLAGLGSPEVLDQDHHCGEWFPSLEEGAIGFPGGVDVWFSNGRVWRFSLAEDSSRRLIWP